MKKLTVKSPGSATIINAMATGFGSAFGIDLNMKVTIELTENNEIKCSSDKDPKPNLMYECVNNVLKKYQLNLEEQDFGLKIMAESGIPLGSGLSSSSAISNAVTYATSSIISEELNLKPLSDLEIINLGIDASLKCGVTITGSFDDASASYFGGLVITDNLNRKLLVKKEFENKNIIINMPDTPSLSGKVNMDRIKLLSPLVETAFKKACNGDYYNALNLNGLIYGTTLQFDNEIAIKALESGALASGLSGSGSAYVAIVNDEDVENVKNSWVEYCSGDIIVTKTNNKGTISV